MSFCSKFNLLTVQFTHVSKFLNRSFLTYLFLHRVRIPLSIRVWLFDSLPKIGSSDWMVTKSYKGLSDLPRLERPGSHSLLDHLVFVLRLGGLADLRGEGNRFPRRFLRIFFDQVWYYPSSPSQYGVLWEEGNLTSVLIDRNCTFVSGLPTVLSEKHHYSMV